MLTNQQARLSLKELTHKYLKGKDPEYDRLVEIKRKVKESGRIYFLDAQ